LRKVAGYVLRVTSPAYGGNFNAELGPPSVDNAVFWDTTTNRQSLDLFRSAIWASR